MTRELGVFIRQWPDSGEVEVGVLEDWGSWLVMDVGDFAYVMNWNKFDYTFEWIGLL